MNLKMFRHKNILMPIICTHKNIILLLQLIFAGLSSTLTVDNQLVSARNDCFERIALEAMLPFEKTFRTEDTNSLKMCKEKCIHAGDKCQSISFGVHRRGNGTCQLSTQTYSTSGGRPSGVIFDPDFDLYARKSNCFDLSDNTITDTTLSVDGGGDDGYGGLSSTTTVQLPNRPADPGTTLLVLNPTPTTSTTFSNERPTTGYSPGTSTTYGTTPGLYTDSVNPTLGATTPNGDRLYFSHDIYPLYKYPMLYEQNYPAPNDDVYIPGGYASNVPEVNDHYRPPGHYANDDVHTPPHGPPRPVFGLGYGNGFSYGRPESYDPTTTRPYDQSSQADRDRDQNQPGSYTTRPGPPYASDRPDRPGSYPNEQPGSYPSDRPNRPSSYPNDHSDRPGSFPNERPGGSGTYSSDRPDRPGSHPSGSADSLGSYPIDRPDRPMGPPSGQRPTRPDYDTTTPPNYYTRPEYDGLNKRPSYEQRPQSSALPPTLSNGSRPPGDFVDYTNRPDPPNGLSTSMRPPMREPSMPGGGYGDYGYVRRNGTAARPDGGYDGDKTIATYFNPEDYLNGSKRRPGNGYNDRVEGGYGIDKMTENTQYTSHEYADIHLIYGEACCIARAAQRLYAERYPNRRHPGREVFARTHREICEGRIPGRRGGETGRRTGRTECMNQTPTFLIK